MKLFVVKKRSEKHIYAKQQNQNRPAIAWKKKIILLWKCIISYNNLLDQSKKIFLVKQQTSLVETQLLGGVGGGGNCRRLLIDTMAHKHKISKAYNIVWD